MRSWTKKASPSQLNVLRTLNLSHSPSISSAEAYRLIQLNHDRWAALKPTPKQESCLRRSGRWNDRLTRGQAAQMIDFLTKFRNDDLADQYLNGLLNQGSPNAARNQQSND